MSETDATVLAYEPRRVGKDTTITFHDPFGERHELVADADGVVWPADQLEVDHLEQLEYPVARKVLAEANDTIAETVEATPKTRKPATAEKEA